MAPLVGCSKVVSGHGSVNLGRGKINVTQQLLHRTQVGTSFEEVGCERMSERVWEAGHALIENTSDTALIQCTSTHTDEQHASSIGLGELRTAADEPPFECTAGGSSQRHDPLTITFAGDRDEVLGDIGDREPCNLGHPHAGGVQQLEQRPIP